ncbi:YadA-like family protein [Ochrobactrum sp. Marseille-Q0166]|uniref:YadA-like family protein n=1 Tax=Ochrobactrum sp. Marseille-Q0166 TaxID=2761105 RepID=UPI001655B579|nr:YadA-like family protein [Ochrobactrum sp. Marseille-Q0166]MBC8716389.1 YadA-like family protein [Ochrobactrum sp. Marseille-Q0166]
MRFQQQPAANRYTTSNDVSRGYRRRIMAVLRLASSVLGMRRKRLGLGLLGVSGATALISALGPALAETTTIPNGVVCSRAQDGSGSWTCHVPTTNGSFATISGVPSTGPAGMDVDQATLTTLVSEKLGAGAILLGNTSTTAAGENAVAIGNAAFVGTGAIGGVSVGYGALVQTDAINSIAVGSNAQIRNGSTSSIAIGRSAIVGLGGAAVPASYGIAIGDGALAQRNFAIALGKSAKAADEDTIAIGQNSSAAGTYGIAIGRGATGSGGTAFVALGAESKASREYATAVGRAAAAGGYRSSAFGSNSEALADYSTAIGTGSKSSALYSTAIGYRSAANGQRSLALGNNAQANIENSVVLGPDSGVNASNGGSTEIGAIFIGSSAGNKSTGTWNTFIGPQNVGSNSAGRANVAIGQASFYNGQGNLNTNLGGWSGNNSHGSNNVAVGIYAGANTQGDFNVVSGESAGRFSVGDRNVSSGVAAGYRAEGSDNVISGTSAGIGIAGSGNVALGQSSATGYTVDPNSLELRDREGNVVSDPALAKVRLNDTISLGNKSYVAADGAMAIGAHAEALGLQSIAVGYNAIATGSVAMGTGARAGNGGAAFGDNAIATYLGGAITAGTVAGTALGEGSAADISGAVALGTDAQVTAVSSVALGAGSIADGSTLANAAYSPAGNASALGGVNPDGEVSIGSDSKERRITHLAAGSAATDAVNVSQLKAAQTHYYSVNDGGTTGDNFDNDGAVGVSALAAGVEAKAAGDYSTAIGNKVEAVGQGSVALGQNSSANDSLGVAINGFATGTQATAINGSANGIGSVAIGGVSSGLSQALGDGTVAIGWASIGANTSATAVGYSSKAYGQRSVALGANNYASADDSFAAGVGSTASANYAIAIGGTASVENGVSLGNGSVADRVAGNAGYDPLIGTFSTDTSPVWKSKFAAVSIGSDGNTRQIINLAAGSNDTDAVNVAQLKAATDAARVHYYSVNDGGTATGNFNNDGAVGTNALAAGINAFAEAESSVAVGRDNRVSGNSSVNSASVGSSNTILESANTVAIGVRNDVVQSSSVGVLGGGNSINATSDTTINGLNNTVDTSYNSGFFGGDNSATNVNSSVVVGSNNSLASSGNVGVIGGLNSLRSTLASSVIGIGNALSNTSLTSVTGVSNEVSNTSQANVIGVNNAISGGGENTIIGSLNTLTDGTRNYVGGFWNTLGTSLSDNQVLSNRGTISDGVSNGVLIGVNGSLEASDSVAIGTSASVKVAGGIALGSQSVAYTGPSVSGYNPSSGEASTDTSPTWLSTLAALSVGDSGKGLTRQINGVAAGTEDTDAVNVAQLKDIGAIAKSGWKLRVNGDAETQVTPGETVEFKNGQNINLSRNGSEVTIATADDLMATSITTGNSKLTTSGLVVNDGANVTTIGAAGLDINGGPKVTIAGIDGGSQRIRNVAVGVDDTDAVNVSQLQSATGGITAKGLDFVGNEGSAVHRDLGQTVSLIGSATTAGVYSSGNLKTVATSDGLEIQMAESPKFGNVTINDDGTGKITGVAAGSVSSTSQDAVNGSQLFDVSSSIVSHLGGSATVNADGTVTGPVYVMQGGNYSTVYDTFAAVDGSLTNISNSLTTINNGGGIKYFHANSTAADSQATGIDSVAIGGRAESLGAGSIAVGNGASTNIIATGAVALGQGSTATAAQGVALGEGASASTANSVALGAGSETGAVISTAGTTINGKDYAFAGSSAFGTVSVGKEGGERTISNVAAGQISANSTDAVNGSQLYATNQAVEAVVSNVTELDKFSVKYNNNGVTKSNSITLAGGDPNAPVLISNVAAGLADNDAVNVKQLKDTASSTLVSANSYTDNRTAYAITTANSYTDNVAKTTLNSANAYTDNKFNQLNADIGSVRSEARQAAAIGLAAASLRYDERPGKLSAAVGGGFWRGEGAAALGLGYTNDDQTMRANVSATIADGNWGLGAGLSFTLN